MTLTTLRNVDAMIRRLKRDDCLRGEQLEDRRMLSGTTHSQLIESLNPVSFWRLSELSGSIAVDESDVSSGVYKDGVT